MPSSWHFILGCARIGPQLMLVYGEDFIGSLSLLSLPTLSSTAYCAIQLHIYPMSSISHFGMLVPKKPYLNHHDGLKKITVNSLILLLLRVGVCGSPPWICCFDHLSTAKVTLHYSCRRVGHKKPCSFRFVLLECLLSMLWKAKAIWRSPMCGRTGHQSHLSPVLG